MARVDNQDFFFNKQSITSDDTTQGQTVLEWNMGAETVELPDSSYIRMSDISRDAMDLIINSDHGSVRIESYFAADNPPNLVAPDGSTLTPKLVQSFVKSTLQYADAGSMNDESPVGAIEELSGTVTITHPDGTVETGQIGTPVFQGDIIETEGSGAVNIKFMDDTSFAISENARLAIDEYVFDPATNAGTTDFSVLNGVFVFTSGLIGREDPDDVRIETPIGSIGIRGTIIAGNVDTGEITVVEGAIVLNDSFGNEVTLATQFETAKFVTETGTIEYMGQQAASDVAARFSTVSTVSPSLFSSIQDSAVEEGTVETAPPAENGETQTDTNGTVNTDDNGTGETTGTGDKGANLNDNGLNKATLGQSMEKAQLDARSAGQTDIGKTEQLQTSQPSRLNLVNNTEPVFKNLEPVTEQSIANPDNTLRLPQDTTTTTNTGTTTPPQIIVHTVQENTPNAVLADIVSHQALSLIGPSAQYYDLIRSLSTPSKYTLRVKPGVVLDFENLDLQINLRAGIGSTSTVHSFFLNVQDINGIDALDVPHPYTLAASENTVWTYDFRKAFVNLDNSDTFTSFTLSADTITDLNNSANVTTFTFDTTSGLLTISFGDGLNTSETEDFTVTVTATNSSGQSEDVSYDFTLHNVDYSMLPGTLNFNGTVLAAETLSGAATLTGSNNLLLLDSASTNSTITVNGNENVIHTGTGNDTITINTGSNQNKIFAGDGNDTIVLHNLNTKVYGMGGDDTFVLSVSGSMLQTLSTNASMAQNLHINGDGGYDTLHLAQGGNLDFTTVQNGMIRNIEHIEANNSAVNNITLNYDDVIAMTDSNNKLVLDVDAVDTVTFDNLGHGTTYNGTVNEGGETYHSYTSGGVTLLINTDITAGNITV